MQKNIENFDIINDLTTLLRLIPRHRISLCLYLFSILLFTHLSDQINLHNPKAIKYKTHTTIQTETWPRVLLEQCSKQNIIVSYHSITEAQKQKIVEDTTSCIEKQLDSLKEKISEIKNHSSNIILATITETNTLQFTEIPHKDVNTDYSFIITTQKQNTTIFPSAYHFYFICSVFYIFYLIKKSNKTIQERN